MKWPEVRLSRKTYGRIYVSKPEDVAVVEATVREVDEFEFDYMPKGLIAVYGTDDELVYLHKFEIDANALAKACMDKNVWIWVVDGARGYA